MQTSDAAYNWASSEPAGESVPRAGEHLGLRGQHLPDNRRSSLWWPGMGAGVDFVVFGFGLGAILMLVGFALRDLGPWLFGSTRDEQVLPEFEGAKSTIRKQTLSSIGNAVSVGGAGIAAVTFSALLAKTDDDLGAIVVGMSLVLATVGVAAWTYDIFRRYRTAMDIVAAQEQAVRERMAPRAKRRRARPAAPEPQTAQSAVAATSSEAPAVTGPAPADQVSEDAPVSAEISDGAADDHLPAWHDAEAAAEPVSPPEGATGADPGIATAVPAGDPGNERKQEVDTLAPAPMERSQPLNETLPPQPDRQPERVELPPLPVEADDALIDEAVRFEPREQAQRTVPSWLFEDLETDLTIHNPGKQDDPVDQFQEAKPFTRPSALERLLSDESDERQPPTDDQSPRRPGIHRPDRDEKS